VPPVQLVTRLTDVARAPQAQLLAMPPVDWAKIGLTGPTSVTVDYKGPTAPLPKADVALLTWTSAEWSALDHVFIGSDGTSVRGSDTLSAHWYEYTADVGSYQTDNPTSPLWGYYQLVDCARAGGKTVRVLLFKADAHLAHPPWMDGLVAMANEVLNGSGCEWIYSIGTAGGTTIDEQLGDVTVTNAADILLQCPGNADGALKSGASVTGTAFPGTGVLGKVRPLLYDMSQSVTEHALDGLFADLQTTVPDAAKLKLSDLVNDAVDPAKLGEPNVFATAGKPLLSTDYYYIGDGNDAAKYVALEMDDAVIGYAAQQAGKSFVFVRNISDTLVPATAADGTAIPYDVRKGWSGELYRKYGLYTAYNGAIVAWAAIVG
jgi:hypothetical protein